MRTVRATTPATESTGLGLIALFFCTAVETAITNTAASMKI